MKSKAILIKKIVTGLVACMMVFNIAPAVAEEEPINLYKSIYERPYSLWENEIDSHMLKRNTLTFVGVGLGTMAFLYAMPSSFTNWEDDGKSPFSKWWDNVSRAPVWDSDDFFLNYVTHPYAGAIYYMGARSAGANAGYSFLYSFMLSTFFWEYGVEAFAERPSIQDLFVTPIFGSLFGEAFYLAKRNIVENDYKLWGSRFWGKTAAVLMDPLTEISDLIFDDDDKMRQNLSIQSFPYMTSSGDFSYKLSIRYAF